MNKKKIYLKKCLAVGALASVTLCSSFSFAETANNQLSGGEIQSKVAHQFGKVEIRMFSQHAVGTTSTFFWWRDGGQECGSQWNEIDIELLPIHNTYQSNPIWQTADWDCDGPQRSEAVHGGSDSLFGRWVVYTVEWTPDYIAWSHDGIEDRRITKYNHPSVNFIQLAMKYCFNLWTQGTGNEAWLGNLDFNALQNKPIYQFVDYFKFYDWNGSGFNSSASTDIGFSSANDIYDNFNISDWEFGQSLGYLSWSQYSVGVADLGNGNGALWLSLSYSGQERPPVGSEIPASATTTPIIAATGDSIVIEAESALYTGGLEVAGDQLGYITDGSWASYAAVNIGTAGEYQVSYQVAGDNNVGSIQLEQNGGGTVYGSVSVPGTAGWINWTTVSHIVTLPAGENTFGLYFATGGFNINSFTITPVNTTPVTPPAAVVNVQAESTTVYTELTVAADSLGYINDGAWARYGIVNIATAGDYTITYQVASANATGVIQLEQAGGGTVYGTVNVPNTGGWTNWTPVSHTVSLPAGDLDYALAFPTGGFNIESFTITAAQ